MDRPTVSVVVTVLNDRDNLTHLLDDLTQLEWPDDRLEVVLVDGGSTDGTWELIRDFAEASPFAVKTLQKTGPIGAGRNAGFAEATGTFVAVTDADMRVPPDWIDALVAGMDEGIGVVGGPNNRATEDLASRCVGAIPVHGPTLDEVPVVGSSRYRSDFTTDEDVYACVTRNSLFRKTAFEEAGGFDETLVATEDPELNHRILQAGYRLRYRRDAAVRHVHRQSLPTFFRQQRNYARGQALANETHPGMFHVKQILPLAAAVAFVALAVGGLLIPSLWLGAAAVLVGVVALTLFYATKAAVLKADLALLVAMPIFFVAWQLAWVVGYPQGVLERRTRPGGTHRG